MWIEKQIQIETKEWDRLTSKDLEDIQIINYFLIKHKAEKKEENEETITSWVDEDVKVRREWLKTKFNNRISFIESNPKPESYKIYTEQNKSAAEQRELLTQIDKATEYNKDELKSLIEVEKDAEGINKIEEILNNYNQNKAEEYNEIIEDTIWYSNRLITNKIIEESRKSFEKYDKDQKRLIEQLKKPVYLEKLKKEFNCSDQEAQEHLNTRIWNCSVWYELDDYWNYRHSVQAHYSPDEEDKKHATILPPKWQNTWNRYVLIHEIWWHRVTNAEWINMGKSWWLSDYAKNELLSSYEARNNWKIRFDSNQTNNYLMNISERYARKKVLDFEMEDLWIKKYEEPFTEETYKKLMEYYERTIKVIDEDKYIEERAQENKLLSKNAIQFIDSTKPDPNVYMVLFNNIA